MKKTENLEQIDPRLLVLDERFQSRQTNLINSITDKAASDNSRQRQIKNILTSLENGNGIKEAIEAYELDGKLFVVSGFHRTEACHQYLKDKSKSELKALVKVFRGYSEAEAYLDSLTKNLEHGTALDKSEMLQNHFKRHLMQGEHLELPSQRDLAKQYDCGKTQGKHIQDALTACMEAGLPTSQEWMSDYRKATENLQGRLFEKFVLLSLDDFDKDGFPLIRKLADAYNNKQTTVDMSDEEFEKKEISYQLYQLEQLIAKNPNAFRKALGRLDKKTLGLVVKRQWDEEAVILRYADNYADDF